MPDSHGKLCSGVSICRAAPEITDPKVQIHLGIMCSCAAFYWSCEALSFVSLGNDGYDFEKAHSSCLSGAQLGKVTNIRIDMYERIHILYV